MHISDAPLTDKAATTVGALDAGSITSGFGAINNGASAITTTGTVSTGALSPSGTITHTGAAHNHELDGGTGAVSQLISNTGTAANDMAYLELKTAGNGGGAPWDVYTAPHIRYTHGGATYNWYTGVDLTQYEADTFYIGTGTTVGSSAAVSISRQNGRNVPGFRIDPLDFTSSGTTSDVGGYTFNSMAHNITWSSDPGDNSGAKWQINILQGGTMVNTASAQAFTNAMGATTLSVTPPSAGSNITFTAASGINIHNVASAGTTTNLYGIYIDNLSGGATDIGLSTSDDIDLRSSGSLINVGNAGNDWTANQLILANNNAGGSNIFAVKNTNTDNASSHAVVYINAEHASAGDAYVRIRAGGGSGDYVFGVDNTDESLKLSRGAALGTTDTMRVTTAGATTFDSVGTEFTPDYVCDGCGKARIESFECCGIVAWHDDVLALREMKLSQAGIDQMAKLGVLEIDGTDDSDPGWMGINYQKGMYFTWAGMWQNRQRMDSQYEQLNKRLEVIGA